MELIYYEACLSEKDSFKREKYLKTTYGRRYLKNRLKEYFTGWTEGFARRGNREFVQFLFISKSSAAEVQSHLYVAFDRGYISQDDFDIIYNQAETVSKMDSGFIKYLNSQLNKPNEPKQLNKPK